VRNAEGSRATSGAATAAVDPRLLAAFRAGDRLACARVISLVENSPELVPAVKEALATAECHAVRIGITGPPGSGKSTLVNTLVQQIRAGGKTVGVIAVDPSSPFTGGAFLGDRVRMRDVAADAGVFIRSMASREGRGGLSPAAHHAADVLEAFGMDVVVLETLGVGQAELDVIYATDVVVLLLPPGSGDAVQALKAGIMEIADMFVVNKADLPGADDAERAIRYLLELRQYAAGEWEPPILRTVATRGEGVPALWEQIERAVVQLKTSGRYRQKRIQRVAQEVQRLVGVELLRQFEAALGLAGRWQERVGAAIDGGRSPYALAQEWVQQLRVEVRDVSTE
jgi:LAO/AO transport system kinase